MSKDKDGSYQKALDCLDVAVSLRAMLREKGGPLHQYAQILVMEAVAYAVLSVADIIRENQEKEIYCPSCFRKVK